MTRSSLLPAAFALFVFASLGAWLYTTRDARPPAPSVQILFPGLAPGISTGASTTPAIGRSSPRYTDTAYTFSFSYPEGFSPRAIDDTSTRTITLSDSSGTGLQIAVSPYDEPGPLTEARIKQDLPNLPMSDVRTVTLSGGTQALAFLSSGGAFGESVEVWFVRGKALYQISAYRSQAALVQQVVSTLSF